MDLFKFFRRKSLDSGVELSVDDVLRNGGFEVTNTHSQHTSEALKHHRLRFVLPILHDFFIAANQFQGNLNLSFQGIVIAGGILEDSIKDADFFMVYNGNYGYSYELGDNIAQAWTQSMLKRRSRTYADYLGNMVVFPQDPTFERFEDAYSGELLNSTYGRSFEARTFNNPGRTPVFLPNLNSPFVEAVNANHRLQSFRRISEVQAEWTS